MSDKRLTRRQFFRLGASLGLGMAASVPLLAACGPTPTPTPKVAEKVAKETPGTKVATPAAKAIVTVRMQAWSSYDVWRRSVARHEGRNPGIKVQIEETVYAELPTKAETGYISDTQPDLLCGHDRWFYAGVWKGIYAPFDDYFKADPPPGLQDDIIGNYIELWRWEDGKRYGGLPINPKPGSVPYLVWNEKLLKEFGVQPPEEGSYGKAAWNEMIPKFYQATNKEKGIFGFEAPNATLNRMCAMMRCWGKDSKDDKSGWLMSEDGKTFRFTEPNCAAYPKLALQMLRDRVHPKATDAVTGGLFNAGLESFLLGGDVYQSQLAVGDKFHVGYCSIPRGPEGRMGFYIEGNQWLLGARAHYPDEAYKLMLSLGDTETGIDGLLTKGGRPGGRRSAWLNPEVLKLMPERALMARIMDAGLEPYPMPYNLRSVEVDDTYTNESNNLWTLEKTWDEYAPVVRQRVQQKMDEPRPPKAVKA